MTLNMVRKIVCAALSLTVCLGLFFYPARPAAASDEALSSGAAAFASGDYSVALQKFTQAIESSPELGYSNRCLVQLQVSHYRAAVSDCLAALALNSHSSEALLNLGLAYHRLGSYDQASESYRQLLEIAPNDYRAYYNLGLTEVALGNYTQAVASYTQALEHLSAPSPSLATVYRGRGVAYMLLAADSRAIADLNAAVRHNPNDAWTYFNRGCAYYRSGQLLPALQDFSWVIAQDKENARAHLNQGLVYVRLGQTDLAVYSLQQAARYFQATDETAWTQETKQLLERFQSGHQHSLFSDYLPRLALAISWAWLPRSLLGA